jgi:hypothetical protein
MEHPFDESSDFDMIYLSTRITRIEHKMLNEIQGWLQTTNNTATIRKQETVRRTIRMAHAYLLSQIESMDEVSSEIQHEPVTQIVSIMPAPVTKNQQSFDIKAYYEMSNKTPQQKRVQNVSDKMNLIQKKLGL